MESLPVHVQKPGIVVNKYVYYLLKNIKKEEWERTVFHPEHNRTITLWNLLAMYAWHCKHHVAHVTKLKERNGWQ